MRPSGPFYLSCLCVLLGGMALGRWLGELVCKLLPCLLACALFCRAQAPVAPRPASEPALEIRHEHRVKNADPSGVCWFCCAATLGKHSGILPLQDLDKRVLKTGIGHKDGASKESIDHWMKELKLKPLVNEAGSRDRAAVDRLQGWLAKGLPVIVTYAHPKGLHAVVLTRISRGKEAWSSSESGRFHDYKVTYIDPDDTQVRHAAWTWFYGAWTGKAYAFDPAMQDPSLLERRRFLLADRERLMKRALFYSYGTHSANPVALKIPSNQDLKDGVTRPLDFFKERYYVPPGHDYYSEYQAWKRAKERPRP